MSSRERYTLGHDDAALESFGTRTASSHAAFFLPHLKPGMRILDCGCGPGSITVGLAQAVAPGEAVGIDIGSSSLEAAAALASEQGVSNVRFEEADIYDLPFPDESFDAAFSHNVLAHLTDPLAAVMEMKRILKTGGVVGLRDVILGGFIHEPNSPGVEKAIDLIVMAVKSGGGGDENIGRRLSALLSQSGLEKEDFGASYELHENSGPSSSFVKEIAVYINVLNTRIRDQVLDSGWATEQEIEQALEGARQFANDPNAVQARATCHVVGRKAA